MKGCVNNVFYLYVFALVQSISALDYTILSHSIQSVKKKRSLNSIIHFLEAADGSQYVVKQYKYTPIGILLATTITELVANDIGQTVGVPLDVTNLIPIGVACIGKETHMPASLHVHAPGVRFDKFHHATYKAFSICQKDTTGLTRDIVRWMSLHSDLAKIVAYDTFIGNNDRNNRNLFYDVTTDSFMGIDMGAAFCRDLCKPSQGVIRALLEGDEEPITREEHESLIVYRNTLTSLVKNYCPSMIEAMLDTYAQDSGIFSSDYFPARAHKRLKSYIAKCKRTLRQSYIYAQELIALIDQLCAHNF